MCIFSNLKYWVLKKSSGSFYDFDAPGGIILHIHLLANSSTVIVKMIDVFGE